MSGRSAKRQFAAKDLENSPPNSDVKRSKHKASQADVENASFITPKSRRALTPRSSNTSHRFVTPTPRRRRLSLGQHRLSSIEFHGIPSNPLKTLLISESVKSPTPIESIGRNSVSSYFTHRKRGVRKSDRSFADLRIPRLSPRQFEKAIPKTSHLDEKENDRTFIDWKMQIDMGHNLLIYGFGSNIELLETFGKSDHCDDGAVLSVDGFRGTSAIEILRQCAKLYSDRDVKKESVREMIDLIRGDHRKLYLLINSIDSLSLRKKQDQGILAKLATCPNIMMVATMQHVNGGLLWDAQMAAAFGWSLYAVHNCQHYFHETSDRPLILNPTKGSGEEDKEAMASALMVLKSFVPNAQQIFVLLALQKLSPVPLMTPLKAMSAPNTGNRRSTASSTTLGFTFDLLYKKCKEHFLVSNVSIFKSHLNDFITHDLIAKENDGKSEAYTVLLENEHLEKIVKELQAAKE